ncbi:hypothetical protein F5051DRAFT_443773 [Lentinula edodes]|nr:hypothetical protein F5051DRAFT_443773 [Lentinula edodes]
MDLIADGAPADKVNHIIHSIGKALGINVVDNVSNGSIRRVVRSANIAACIQVVQAIHKAPAISISGDGTSHKNLNYESQYTAVIDPNTGEKQIYFLGIALAPSHTSEEQLNGWADMIHEMYKTYCASPEGQRNPLTEHTFYKKVLGMVTDYAANQKKLASLFVELKRLMDPELGVWKINAAGGPAAWDALSETEKICQNDETYHEVLRHFGEEDFQKLSSEQQAEIENAHKGATARMAQYWEENHKTPPILLMNKDNAAAAESGNASEKACIEKVSLRGGVKLTELMGLLLKHNNSKKGQQDRHGIYFEAHEHIGFFIRFPDTSNTRYQLHCDAAAEILVHLPVYREMLKFIRDEKVSGKFNHLEYNVYRALHNIPTLTELAGHTLSLLAHLEKVRSNPELLCGPNASYTTGSLDRQPWERPEAVYSVLALSSQLPDLHGIVIYLFKGAINTWTRFCAEIIGRNLSSNLSNQLYIPSTNDYNESALSDLRQMKVRAPNAMLDWTNARMTLKRNQTGDFVRTDMNTLEAQTFLQGMERAEEAKGNAKKQRKLIASTSQKKVAETRVRKLERQRRKDARCERVRSCLPLTDVTRMHNLLDGLGDNPSGRFDGDIKVTELELQLDWHRDREQRAGKTDLSIGPTSKLGNKVAKLELLLTVVEAWNIKRGTDAAYMSSEQEEEDADGEEDLEKDSEVDDIGYTHE